MNANQSGPQIFEEYQNISVKPRLNKAKKGNIFDGMKDDPDYQRVAGDKKEKIDIFKMKADITAEDETPQNDEISWLLVVLAVIVIVLVVVIVWYVLKNHNAPVPRVVVDPVQQYAMRDAYQQAQAIGQAALARSPAEHLTAAQCEATASHAQSPNEHANFTTQSMAPQNVAPATKQELNDVINACSSNASNASSTSNASGASGAPDPSESEGDCVASNLDIDIENLILDGDIDDDNLGVLNPDPEDIENFYKNAINDE